MSPLTQLLVLGAIALYLFFRLRNVLGTRDGFEDSSKFQRGITIDQPGRVVTPDEPEIDPEILDHVDKDSDAARALMEMKRIDRTFSIPEFVDGAGKAYEWILTSFASGDVDDLEPYLSEDVFRTFKLTVEQRDESTKAHTEFVALAKNSIKDAKFDPDSRQAEIEIEFLSELLSYVLDEEGAVIEGSNTHAKRQRDVWIFTRQMDSDDPNWVLVATGT